MAIKIVTKGRQDIDDFFRLSGIREFKKLNHTPLLVFDLNDDTLEMMIVERADRLLEYPDETKVMAQWRGRMEQRLLQIYSRPVS